MGECSVCGEKTMSFTCRYCNQEFCADHRLPENHDCDGMEGDEEGDRWFRKPDVEAAEPEAGTGSGGSPLDSVTQRLSTSITMAIIAATSVFFVAQLVFGFRPGSFLWNQLILQPGVQEVLQKPWTLLSVMVLHGSPFHLLANMVTLYFFGTALERVMDEADYLKFYIGSGVAASIGFVLFRNLLAASGQGASALGPAVGASGAVVAVFAAVAMLYPDAEMLLYFIVPMKLKTGLYLFAALEGFNMLAKSAGIVLPVIGGFASSAHMAGLIVGYWYGKKLRDRYQSRLSVFDLLR